MTESQPIPDTINIAIQRVISDAVGELIALGMTSSGAYVMLSFQAALRLNSREEWVSLENAIRRLHEGGQP